MYAQELFLFVKQANGKALIAIPERDTEYDITNVFVVVIVSYGPIDRSLHAIGAASTIKLLSGHLSSLSTGSSFM